MVADNFRKKNPGLEKTIELFVIFNDLTQTLHI